jgi:hypothetical protein
MYKFAIILDKTQPSNTDIFLETLLLKRFTKNRQVLNYLNYNIKLPLLLNYMWGENWELPSQLPPMLPVSSTTSYTRQALRNQLLHITLPLFWNQQAPFSLAPILQQMYKSPLILDIQESLDTTHEPLDIFCHSTNESLMEIFERNALFAFPYFNTKFISNKWMLNQHQSFMSTPTSPLSSFSVLLRLPPRLTPQLTHFWAQKKSLPLRSDEISPTLDFPMMTDLFEAAKKHFADFVAFNASIPQTLVPFFKHPIFASLINSQPLPSSELGTKEPEYWTMARLRFKPGLLISWRIARRDLKVFLNFPVRYQHRLTWRLTKLMRERKSSVENLVTHQIQFLLLRLRWAGDLMTSWKLLTDGVVFLNSFICSKRDAYIVRGDELNLLISWEYYLREARLSIAMNNIPPLWLKLMNYPSLRSNYRVGKVWKAASATNKFNHLVFFWHDTPPFYQLDIFTYSCVILRETTYQPTFSPTPLFHTPIFILNMYNWKYIT